MAKILLIDDDDDFRKMLKTAMERAGHEVTEAVNGEDGHRIFAEHPHELVITDIFMPQKEGIHTIFDFRMAYPDLKIIAISGGGIMAKDLDEDDILQLVNSEMDSESILELATDFGADHVIAKPFNIKYLLQIIDEATAIIN